MKFELFLPKPVSRPQVGFIHDLREKDDDFQLLQKLTFEHSTSFIIAPTLENYKKHLLIKLIFGFIMFLLFILERTFHGSMQQQELNLMINLQELWFGDTRYDPNTSITFFYYYLGKIGEFHVFFLIMTHFLITLYVGVDAIIALKIIYVSFLSTFIMVLFSFMNAEARPYWISSEIQAFYCDRTYSDPGFVTFLSCFLIIYSYRCFNQKGEELLATQPFESSFSIDESILDEWQRQWVNRGLLVIALLIYAFILFMRFLMGLEYLINYILSFIAFAVIYGLVLTTDIFLEEIIKQSTILKLYAKRKAFNWLIFLLILEGLACVIFFQTDYKIDQIYIQNFYSCQHKNQLHIDDEVLYHEVLGKSETFQITSIVFALIGLVFGASQTFRTISSINWYKGPMKMRFLRIFIANFAMIPSWVLIYYQDELMVMKNSGLLGISDFMVDSVHYFVLYYGLFGMIPIHIFLYYGYAFMDLKFSIILTH